MREILPGLAAAAALIARQVPRVQFVVARAPGLPARLFDPIARAAIPRLASVESRTDDVLAAADVAVTASGTATVQTAIHGTPMVVVYRLAPLTYRLFRPFVRVGAYAMVNLVAGRTVAPELIQDDFTPEAVAREALRLLTVPGERAGGAPRHARGPGSARFRWREPARGRGRAGRRPGRDACRTTGHPR